MHRVVCRLRFSAGHRLVGHEGDCRCLHGHNYVVFLHAKAADLDAVGRVVDFAEIKSGFGAWIAANWDHALILWEQDNELIEAVSPFCRGGSPFLLPYNPTAENLARHLVEAVAPKVLGGAEGAIVRADVWETPGCQATYEIDAPTLSD